MDTAAVDAVADVALYGPDEIAERNRKCEVPQYAPQLLLIGDDGGGRGFFVARDDPGPEVVLIGLGALGSDDGEPIGRLSRVLAASDVFRAEIIPPVSVLDPTLSGSAGN